MTASDQNTKKALNIFLSLNENNQDKVILYLLNLEETVKAESQAPDVPPALFQTIQ